MKKDTEKMIVVFRVWKRGGDVIALFPADVWNEGNKRFCNSYEHIGQHGGADYQGVVNQTTPARPEDYYDLMKELEGIGYNLKIQKRSARGYK